MFAAALPRQSRHEPRLLIDNQQRGFTLIEIMVALALMALIATFSWRGIDSLLRAQAYTSQSARAQAILQTALAQWNTDLDQMAEVLALPPLDWNGKVLRMTRSNMRIQPADPTTLHVVAWTDMNIDGQRYWARWQSQPLLNRGQWQAAWNAAQLWSQGQGTSQMGTEVVLIPIQQWQLHYARDGRWTNPQSSAQLEASADTSGDESFRGGRSDSATQSSGDNPQNNSATAQYVPLGTRHTLPESIRLQITIASSQRLSGPITRDWLNPTLGAQR